MIHNHLQQLVRVLGLHYNGKGWEVIRVRLREAIPRGHALENAWLGDEAKTIAGKCFMRMRMVGAYRHVSFLWLLFARYVPADSEYLDHKHLHGPFLNLLRYTGSYE